MLLVSRYFTWSLLDLNHERSVLKLYIHRDYPRLHRPTVYSFKFPERTARATTINMTLQNGRKVTVAATQLSCSWDIEGNLVSTLLYSISWIRLYSHARGIRSTFNPPSHFIYTYNRLKSTAWNMPLSLRLHVPICGLDVSWIIYRIRVKQWCARLRRRAHKSSYCRCCDSSSSMHAWTWTLTWSLYPPVVISPLILDFNIPLSPHMTAKWSQSFVEWCCNKLDMSGKCIFPGAIRFSIFLPGAVRGALQACVGESRKKITPLQCEQSECYAFNDASMSEWSCSNDILEKSYMWYGWPGSVSAAVRR